ncbi:MAG: hypothetical protein AB7P14_26185 [Blastocatellales bacterium]
MPDQFPYHRQNSEDMCGPASAAMISDFLSETTTFEVNQEDIDSVATSPAIASGNPGFPYNDWKTRPDELIKALNEMKISLGAPADIEFYFEYKGCKKAAAFKDVLKSALPKTPIVYPIVPINGEFFYYAGLSNNPNIAAMGYDVEIKNAELDHKGVPKAHWIQLFKLENNGFFANDPYFPKSFGKDIHDRINCCQSKIVRLHFSGSTVSSKSGSPFEKNFPPLNRVAILYREGVFKQPPGNRLPTDFPPIEIPSQPCSNKRLNIDGVIREMRAFNLLSDPATSGYLNKTLTGTSTIFNFGAPRLITRVDTVCNDYRLIPIYKVDKRNKNNKESNVMVRVDGPSGNYLDSLYYSENPLLIDQTTARKHLVEAIIPNRLTEMGKAHWIPSFTQQINDPETPMIWLPCEQSLSPFFPFYVITVKATKERFFVRLDGRVFDKLFY